ncbi:MAG: phosphoglycerate mutase family protein [Victivallaceae bacterium]|nr:hypothetical protein [Victivallaceae bacterium]
MTDILQLADVFSARAQEVMEQSQVVEAWEAIGAKVNLVGSLSMGLLMKHRDFDFHIYTPVLDPAQSFKAVGKICANPRISRMEYRNLADTDEHCLEFHAWYLDEMDEEWQIDMIQILQGSTYDGYFEHVAERIRTVLTPETRRTILELKYAAPDGTHIMGIEYYHAVIGHGVRTWDEFEAWRTANPANGIVDWCP